MILFLGFLWLLGLVVVFFVVLLDKAICSILSGLLVASDYTAGQGD